MAELMYREALNLALFEEMRRDPLVFTLGEGIGERGGSYKVTEGLFNEFGPERVMDTPISEASFTGCGVGAALVGTRPVVEILFVDFTGLIMDQIINQAAKYEFMSGGQGKVPMVLRTQGGAGNGLAGQHSQSLEALFYHIPGLKVVLPATPYDAKGLLKASIRDDNPTIFIEHKLLYMTKGEVPEEDYIVPLGQAEIKRPGDDITLITYSYMTLKCLEVAEILAGEGLSVEVVDLRTLTPLDKETILESVEKTGRAIVVHEAVKRGGVGGDIASMIMEEAYDDLDGPVKRICGKNTTIPYNLELEKVCVPSVAEIIEGILEMV
ncbi:Acetoin dehydrogenase E1 component beta-subunit (EC [Olavius sp. associated proteobacterium Delta 1]|nr:Acetoin dehydrogenase E1 component beta-subunit (EC [Olavius sp. associated proteobacterium Delta 1]